MTGIRKKRATWKRRRGFLLTEATMIYPVVILTVITILYIVLAMYWKATGFTVLYTAGREAAGSATKTFFRGEHDRLYEQQLYHFFQDGKEYEREAASIAERNLQDSPVAAAGSSVKAEYSKKIPFARIKVGAALELGGFALLESQKHRDLQVETTVVDEAQFIRTVDFLTELGEGWSYVDQKE